MTNEDLLWTVFLDRDGVINRKAPEGDYVRDPRHFRWLGGAKAAIRSLNDHGVLTVVVTNQRGVALRKVTPEALHLIHERLERDLAQVGGHVDAILVCPHDKDECTCRKPNTGLIDEAARRFPRIDLRRSFVVGDSVSDIELGRRIGARTVYLTRDPPGSSTVLTYTTSSLQRAVTDFILPTIGRESAKPKG